MQTAPTVCLADPPHAVILDPLDRLSQRKRYLTPVQRLMSTNPSTRDVGQRMSHCASRLGILLELPEGEQARALLQNGWFCKARLCPFCEWRRTIAWRARLIRGLTRLHVDRPTDRGLFLTLTVKNCSVSETGSQIRQMQKAWHDLTRAPFFPTGYWFRRTEFTVNNGCLKSAPSIHPHIHALLVVPASYWGRGYVTQTEWQRQWMMAAGLDYPPVVDIRRATSKKGSDAPADCSLSAAIEAAKYAAKSVDIEKLGALAPELHHQIRGIRLYAVSRRLSHYIGDSEPLGDELCDADEIAASQSPGLHLVACWNAKENKYEFQI